MSSRFGRSNRAKLIKKGSPDSGEPTFIIVGKLGRPHGIAGEIVLQLQTHFPNRLVSGKEIFLGDTHLPYTIESSRGAGKELILKFPEITNREEVAKLTNLFVYVRLDTLPKLKEGEYYYHQLIGCSVFDQSDKLLGVLTEILETRANDVYLVKADDGAEVLLPAIPDVIIQVDIDQKKIIANPPIWE